MSLPVRVIARDLLLGVSWYEPPLVFFPQHQVHVVRPSDASELGVLPSDLIPDLLRVDEDLNVYVAEESGHVAAFGVAPRLALVR